MIPPIEEVNNEMFANLEVKATHFREVYKPVAGDELQKLVMIREKKIKEANKIAENEKNLKSGQKNRTRQTRRLSLWKRVKKFFTCSSS